MYNLANLFVSGASFLNTSGNSEDFFDCFSFFLPFDKASSVVSKTSGFSFVLPTYSNDSEQKYIILASLYFEDGNWKYTIYNQDHMVKNNITIDMLIAAAEQLTMNCELLPAKLPFTNFLTNFEVKWKVSNRIRKFGCVIAFGKLTLEDIISHLQQSNIPYAHTKQGLFISQEI